MKADVLIAGGGIMGCATAIELARKGKSVIIFEKDVPGRHASGNNSGGVRCQGRDVREIAFAVEARKMWDHHASSINSDCGFYVSPRLRLASTRLSPSPQGRPCALRLTAWATRATPRRA